DQEWRPLRFRRRRAEPDPEADHRNTDGEIDVMLARAHDRRTAYAAGELAEGDHRSGKGNRADEGADEELELVAESDREVEPHRLRVVHRRDGDQNGGATQQGMHDVGRARA